MKDILRSISNWVAIDRYDFLDIGGGVFLFGELKGFSLANGT